MSPHEPDDCPEFVARRRINGFAITDDRTAKGTTSMRATRHTRLIAANPARIICCLWLAALGVIAAGCGAATPGGSSATAADPSNGAQSTSTRGSSAKQTFNVASTLDGKTVLPHRIHWVARPAVPASQIREVDFLIDGRQAWIERKPPYTYAEGGGFLVTSWLTPGKHRFSARAVRFHGAPETDTVVACVPPPPQVPAALAGTWQRRITNATGAPAPESAGNPTGTLTPPGRYRITFERRWIHDEFPCSTSPCTYDRATGAGTEFDSDWNPGLTGQSGDGKLRGREFLQVRHRLAEIFLGERVKRA
jgi:hypothetical protein